MGAAAGARANLTPPVDKRAFAARCNARLRERELGTGYGFGVFVGERFAGEINISSVQRGPFQNAYVGYWVDEAMAGNGYTPEAFVVVARFAFEDLMLHRLQVSIIPRNRPSHRVAEKLGSAQRGDGPALPRDQRGVGGPRALRDNVRGLGGKREQYLKDWVLPYAVERSGDDGARAVTAGLNPRACPGRPAPFSARGA